MSSRGSQRDSSEVTTRSTRSQSKSTPQKRQPSPPSQSSTRSSRQRRQQETNPSSQRSTRSNSRLDNNNIEVEPQERSEPLSGADVTSSQLRSGTPLRGSAGLFGDAINLSSPLHYGSTDFPTQSSQTSARVGRKKRYDITSDSRVIRQLNVGDTDGQVDNTVARDLATSDSHVSSAPQLVIWGTDVGINQCREKFKRFLKHMTFDAQDLESDELDVDIPMETDSQSDSQRPYYIRKLYEMVIIGEPFLNINCRHILRFDPTIYRQLISYPQEVVPAFDMAVNEVFTELYPEGIAEMDRICVRPYNVAKTSSLRDLNPEDINQLVTISGMVTRCSNIIAEMCVAFFECTVCNFSVTVEVDRGSIAEPHVCRQCNTNFSFRLVHNRSQFTDKQQIKLQESPDDMPAGQTPYTVLLYACADLVDKVQPGERITVTGIYRATPIRVHPNKRNVKSVYRTHIDVVHYRKVENKRLHDDGYELKLSKERIDQLIALSNMPDIYERLAAALAPSIYEHEDIKKGILLALFGGTRKEFNQSDANTSGKLRSFRSEVNILLCGDPGTSKSQLLQYVYNLVPRGQYTSGKGSSAVGLTAYVTKDPDTKQMVLQTGALVLSDGGICCIDEFDKMSDSTRSVLHEVMEQQTLSIAKAGIVCQLNARTSILAAANPVESQWNKNKTIMENIELPPTLMSRFDLIFLLLDPQDEEYDRRLGRHLVSLYHKSREDEKIEYLDVSLLKDYIGYARMNFHPVLSEEAAQGLKHSYVEMRKVGSGKGQISAYPRQLESLIRLAEAHAKMKFKNVVDMEDVEEARRLHREAIKQSATDPLSGKIDISILTTGMSASNRKRRNEVSLGLKQFLESLREETGAQSESQMQFNYLKVFNDFKVTTTLMVTRDMFDDSLKALQDEGYLTLIGTKFIRINAI
ncbi:DNA replication licensing factor mcm4-A-like [Oppia nitens]|uniref:DNA replication licensing factor mcm4-A-like n=1 Tax=Oppia nitens TaxID=1686743 RepID=UPI0023DA5199|nr:DNA replication licensing factor mcm4-A-like [Oppia nitens]